VVIGLLSICGGLAILALGMRERFRIFAKRTPSDAICRLRTLANAVAYAVLWVDEQGRICECNHMAPQLFGRRPDDLLHLRVVDLVHSIDGAQLPFAIAACVRSSIVENSLSCIHAQAVNSDGATFPVRLTLRGVGVRIVGGVFC
jgi:PAS domain S-box-containing protein